MTVKAKTALAASVAATLLGAGTAMAAPLINFKIQGRVIPPEFLTTGTLTTPFLDTITLTPEQAQAGVDIQYQIIVDMADVGTANANAIVIDTKDANRNNPTGVIKSLDSRIDIDGELNPNVDGFNSMTLDLFQMSSDAFQLSFVNDANLPQGVGLNADPRPDTEGFDNYRRGTAGSSTAGLRNDPRPGAPGFNDRIGIRPSHDIGVFSAVDPENLLDNKNRVPASRVGGLSLVNSFKLGPIASNPVGPDTLQLKGRLNPAEAGLIRINGTGDGIFITGGPTGTESGPDPLAGFDFLDIIVPVIGGGGGDDPILAVDQTAADFGNVLRGAAVSTTRALSKTGAGTASFTATGNGDASVDPTAGTVADAPVTLTLSVDTSTVGAKTGSVSVANTTAGTTQTTPLSIPVSANVGGAAVGVGGAFGAAATASVAPGAAFTDLSATASGAGALGSTASLTGNNATGPAETLSIAARIRAANESFPTQTSPPVPGGSKGLSSDVFEITGFDDATLIEISYDETVGAAGSPITEEEAAALGLIYLARLEGGQFAAAGTGAVSIGAYSDIGAPGLGDEVGRFGVDTANNIVWAVVNTGGTFAAVPEPGTMTMLGIGALGLLARRRK